MTPPQARRSQEERSRETREALVTAAHRLFAERGYADVATEQIVAEAKVTRGALYHHFSDKRDLFRAVHEGVERRLVEGLAEELLGIEDTWELLVTGIRRFLDACVEPDVLQIAMTDAPAVLGWAEWREIDARYGLGMLTAVLERAQQEEILRPGPVAPLAHILLGALTEAAFMVAQSPGSDPTRAEAEQALLTVLEGLRAA